MAAMTRMPVTGLTFSIWGLALLLMIKRQNTDKLIIGMIFIGFMWWILLELEINQYRYENLSKIETSQVFWGIYIQLVFFMIISFDVWVEEVQDSNEDKTVTEQLISAFWVYN